MQVFIYDVGHGSCALVVTPNNKTILLDCGHDADDGGFRPSVHLGNLGRASVEQFIVSHYDCDHVSDLKAVQASVDIQTLRRNKSLTVEQVREIKEAAGDLTAGTETLLEMMSTYTGPVSPPIDYGGVTVTSFYNSYPHFEDMNNLSVVTFVEYDGIGVVFPGDLERAGWLRLLLNPAFRDVLARVNVFVASHHGRENGYCEEVFTYCHPEIIIISDTVMEHESQEHDYAKHASGILWNTGETRRVLTTRRDSHIKIEKLQGQGFRITTGSPY